MHFIRNSTIVRLNSKRPIYLMGGDSNPMPPFLKWSDTVKLVAFYMFVAIRFIFYLDATRKGMVDDRQRFDDTVAVI